MPDQLISNAEEQRLAALRSYHILDTAIEADFDELTELAAAICGTPIALISFVDKDRQWFKSVKGLNIRETTRAESFCAHAIQNPDDLFQIQDARNDSRFSDNPFVTGEPNIVFYAGIPLVDSDGLAIGSLCVIDAQTKTLSLQQRSALRTLARQVMNQLTLRRTVKQLEASESAMALAMADLKDDEQRKSAFMGMVSHELKTPLTSIGGYLHVLQKEANKEGRPFIVNAIDRTIIQVKKMTAIISGFLDASRYESGRIHLSRHDFDLAELLKEAEDESLTVITSHKVVFAPVEYTLVHADRDKIAQVINNLINNAVKYSPAGSTINVACITKNNFAEVCVKDQGMGISLENQQHLFERYYRVEGEHMKSTSGFGIGLYICKEIIDRHNGRIWVQSEITEGSVFCFNLPVK